MEQEGVDMQEVFSKIIEKLEEENSRLKRLRNNCIALSDSEVSAIENKAYNFSIEIVKQEAEKYKDGHFGCNTNGEHERCDGCGLTDCKSRNKIWFGAVDDAPNENVQNNGWIPCGSGVMPRANGWYLVTNHLGVVQEQRWSSNHWEKLRDDAVLAWRELPAPYQPKGEGD